MTISLLLRAHSFPATTSFTPLTAVSWKAAYWAEDPSWTNPGDGGAVASWRDGSGNSNTITEATNKPTFRSADSNMNGRASVEFDGTNDKLRGTFTSDSAQPRSIVLIARIRSLGTSTPVILDTDTGSTKVCALFWDTTDSNKLSLYCGTAQAKYGSVSTGLHAIRAYVSGSSSKINLNGTTTTSAAPTGTQAMSGLTLGTNRTSANFSAITVGFLGIYQGDVTTDVNWPNLVTSLRNLYGVKLS